MKFRTTALAFAVLAFASTGGCRQEQPGAANATQSSGAPAPAEAAARHAAFLAAAMPFKALAEQAQTANDATLKALIGAARKAADGVSTKLDASKDVILRQQLKAIDAARASGERTDLALGAAECFRILASEAPDNGRVPVAVNLLDYAGFRYRAALSASPARWSNAEGAIRFAQRQWAGLSGQVADPDLRNAVIASLDDMHNASTSHDAAAGRKAANRALDLIDRLGANLH
ncbi:hypothetical protein RXV95_05320 [Novosphingobium sp. ZN18A2]|uniref:hypothetical protein n=1 Tax=Novosphingobium sp. ZN18A2 TaxID=3079861 RepID=UPI0030D03AC9